MACLARRPLNQRDELNFKLSSFCLLRPLQVSLLSKKGISYTKEFIVSGNRKRFLVKRWLSQGGGGGGCSPQTISHMLVTKRRNLQIYIKKCPQVSSPPKIP